MDFGVIGTIAWRELLLYLRNKGRVIGTLGVPFFYLVVLGFGLNSLLSVRGTNYFSFLVAGVVGMVILFQSIFSALSVVTERQFGFLKEILVAPVKRTDIVLGKAVGNAATATIQGILVLIIGFALGFQFTQAWWVIPIAVVIMFATALGFVGLGLIFASRITDPQTFQVLFNFLIMPLFLLSGAVFPIESAPLALRTVAYLDPLTYSIDALRGLLIGVSPIPIWVSALVIVGVDAAFILLAAYLFRKIE